jgi:hypothetical protein
MSDNKSEGQQSDKRTFMSSRMRAKIEREMAQAEAERLRENLRKRLEVARMGVDSLVKESFGEATKSFLTYIRLLEISKKVEPRRLHPSLFDAKKDLPELVLLTGIYWDLARTFDRMKSSRGKRDHVHYLDQFVMFSKSASYKPLCAETLRKYLAADKPLHRSDFKAAYKQLGGNTCFIASSLLDLTDPDAVRLLCRFRDEQLMRHRVGRWLVCRYEEHAPRVARMLDVAPPAIRRLAAWLVDGLARVAGLIS